VLSPTGSAYAKLYAHTGTFGTSTGKPTGDPLATSAALDVSTLTESYELKEFSSFTGTLTLSNGTPYFITIEYSGGDATNYLYVGADSSSPSHEGASAAKLVSTSLWGGSSSYDMIFYVYAG